MRSNNLIVLIVAVVLGGVAALLARNWLISHAQTAEAGTIVVAAVPLAFGSQLSAENLSEIPWAAGDLPKGAFTNKQAVLRDGRRMALAAIARNEPILRDKITGPGQRATLSTVLSPDKRAVTIRVDDVRGVAGFIQPGDRVDVVLIRSGSESKSGESYSDVILQAVKVLAIDQITGERTEQATIAKAVTLEVSAEDAQKILLGTNIGKLSLILRQPDEGGDELIRRVTERDLNTAAPRVEPAAPVLVAAAAPTPAQAPSVRPVTIWLGMNSQQYETPIDVKKD
ncbi:MAG: Flp pilus assembly protein CpaB [Xanthobacteraceae bacterium]